MDRPVELVPLLCLRCSTPLPAEAEEMAWVCANCGQGMHLDLEKGLQPVNVNYLAGLQPAARGKPYWVADGSVSLQRRDSYGKGDSSGQAYWSQPRRFFIPAYTATLEALLADAQRLLFSPPALQPGPAVGFEPVTRAAEDVRAAAEFLVVAVEAGRKDKLKKLDFSLELGPAVLWILPG